MLEKLDLSVGSGVYASKTYNVTGFLTTKTGAKINFSKFKYERKQTWSVNSMRDYTYIYLDSKTVASSYIDNGTSRYSLMYGDYQNGTITFTGGSDINNSTFISFVTDTQNGTVGVPTKTIDLSSTTWWSNITSGEHNIAIIAKSEGYGDSKKSSSVKFIKD